MKYVFKANTPDEFKQELETLLKMRIRQEQSLLVTSDSIKAKLRITARVAALEELLIDISFAEVEPTEEEQ
jgi:hypothetical protein